MLYSRSLEETKDYISSQSQWEKYSSLRTRPRRILKDEENIGDYFPESRQPILAHPLLQNIDSEKRKFVLAQSLFLYMNEIAHIETDIINYGALGVLRDRYSYIFPFEIKFDALSIIIDESYHAYVAMDFMRQVAEYENFEVLPFPKESALSQAIAKTKVDLPPDLSVQWDLIAIAIAEHALTNDLLVVAKVKGVCKTFFHVMHDHVLDEKRHANFFEYVLRLFWSKLEEKDKKILGPLIPKLVAEYNNPNMQKEFDLKILNAIEISDKDSQDIVEATHFGWKDQKIDTGNIVSRQMIDMLKRAEVFSHPVVQSSFKQYGIQ